MSNYSPVAPVKCLREIQKEGFLGNYLLLLAHDVVDKENEYKALLQNFTGTIIMDNSLIELGSSVSIDTMAEAVRITNATYAVLPDVLHNSSETITASITAARLWRDLKIKSELMIVAQGNTVTERVQCIEEIINNASLTNFAIGIPRAIVKQDGTRLSTIEALEKRFHVKMHLLGFSVNYNDDIRCARSPNIMGIDSATPIRLGWEDKLIPLPSYTNDTALQLRTQRDKFFIDCYKFNLSMAYNLGAINAAINTY